MPNEVHLESGLSHLLISGPFSAEQAIRENPRVSEQCPPAPAVVGQGCHQFTKYCKEEEDKVGRHCEVGAVVHCWLIFGAKPGLCTPHNSSIRTCISSHASIMSSILTFMQSAVQNIAWLDILLCNMHEF